MIISGKITGPGGLLKTGAQTLAIQNASNDYAGDTFISAGTLQIDSSGALPASTALTVNGELDLNTNSATARSIAGSGIIDGDGSLTINPANDLLFNGKLQNVASVKGGSGTLTSAEVTGNGSDPIVASGTLVLAKTGTGFSGVNAIAATPRLTIDLGAVARLGGTGDDQIDNTVDVVANGTFDFNGHNEAFHGLSGNGSVLNSLASSSSTITLGQGDFYGQIPASFSGSISNGSGTVSLIKRGGLTQSLYGACTYTGPTTIGDGTLAVNGSLTNTLNHGSERSIGQYRLGNPRWDRHSRASYAQWPFQRNRIDCRAGTNRCSRAPLARYQWPS